MQDEPTNTNEVEEVVADAPQPAEPTVEETQVEATEEQTTEETVSEEAPKEEETVIEDKAEEEPPKPSRRETLRVQNLLKKYGHPQKKQEPLNTKPALDYKTLDAEPEVIKQLETDRQSYSDNAYQQGLRQSEVREWKRDLKYDAPVVEKEYPFLNPKDKANFNEAAADAMNQKYLRFVGYEQGNPEQGVNESVQYSDVSYKEFVDSEMEFIDEIASRRVETSTKNIAKQAAATGIRPDGSSAKRLNLNKAPQDMTLEELYAVSGFKPNKK